MSMEAVKKPMVAVDVWQAYRQAFENFAQKVRRVQLLAAQPGMPQDAVDQALIELETAHVLYNVSRDILAEQYLPSPAAPRDTPHPQVSSVKDLADDSWRHTAEIAGLAKPGCC
jgi:hypothetical protein